MIIRFLSKLVICKSIRLLFFSKKYSKIYSVYVTESGVNVIMISRQAFSVMSLFL